MRRLLISVVAALILAAPSAAVPVEYSYSFVYMNNNGGYKSVFATLPFADAGPGYDYELPNTTPFRPVEIALTFYKENGGDGWDGPTGFYVDDYQACLQPGQTAVVGDIYLWAGPAVTPTNLQLYIFESHLDPGLTYKLRLVQIPLGITYTGPREWGPNHGVISLPFFATDDFTKGYMFRAEITAVPEPSSLVALAGSLFGLGMFQLRRHR